MTEALTVVCPECSKDRIFKDGTRKLLNGERKQLFICRDCGYRFSEKANKDVMDINGTNQICALKDAKNLAAQENKICARDAKLPPNVAGLVAQFLAYLEKEGFCKETEYPNLIRRLAKLGANLLDSETVKEAIARAD